MNHDVSKYEYLSRHDKTEEIDLKTVMTKDTEKLLNQKERYEKKREKDVRIEQAKQLRLQKVHQQIKADRNKELVSKDFEAAKISDFEEVYQKLMGDPDELPLPVKYVGTRKL